MWGLADHARPSFIDVFSWVAASGRTGGDEHRESDDAEYDRADGELHEAGDEAGEGLEGPSDHAGQRHGDARHGGAGEDRGDQSDRDRATKSVDASMAIGAAASRDRDNEDPDKYGHTSLSDAASGYGV